MREEEKELNWFSRWEEELPRPEELMPLSQTLITPGLAVAFDIPTNTNATPNAKSNNQDTNISSPPLSTTLKKPRLVWTPQLHKRFVEAVAHLGIKNAVPKTIMQLMNVDGLTRENVASHLQKYRLYLKRMQHSSSSSFVGDAASDRLFATAPVPSQFLRAPFVPVAAMQHYRPMPAAAVNQNQYYIQNHMGMMTVPPNPGMNRMTMFRPPQPPPPPPSYLEELDSAKQMGRRVLSLFPDGED